MFRHIRPAAVTASVALALTCFSVVTGAPAATGQPVAAPPEVAPIVPGPVAPTAGPRVMPASPGTVTDATEPATAAPVPPSGGAPVGTESVIGPDGRVRVTDTTAYPASAIGQIELVRYNGSAAQCTGWLIDGNTILTSGHCAYEPAPSGDRRIRSATFSPGRNGAVTPFGTCGVTSVWAPLGWRVKANAWADFAVMQLNCNIGATVGHLGIFAVPGTNGLAGVQAKVEGYPGDKPFGTQWKMGGTIHHSTDRSVFYAMDTAGGQSGSPVFQPNRSACGGPCAMAIHSYSAVGNPLNNSGPRITAGRFDVIRGIADDNGG